MNKHIEEFLDESIDTVTASLSEIEVDLVDLYAVKEDFQKALFELGDVSSDTSKEAEFIFVPSVMGLWSSWKLKKHEFYRTKLNATVDSIELQERNFSAAAYRLAELKAVQHELTKE